MARPLPVAPSSMVVNRERSRQRLGRRVVVPLRGVTTPGPPTNCDFHELLAATCVASIGPRNVSGPYGFGRPWPTPKPNGVRELIASAVTTGRARRSPGIRDQAGSGKTAAFLASGRFTNPTVAEGSPKTRISGGNE